MLAAGLTFFLLILLVLALFIGACAAPQRSRPWPSLIPGVEVLEDRVVPALSLGAVKARIAAEFPAVADPATPDAVRVSLLRTWAFQQADFGDGPARLDTRPGIDYYSRSLPELVRLFDRDAGGVQSAGSAYFLMKLYEVYGYRTGRLSIGSRENGTHTVTLVQVNLGDERTSILIEDAATDRTAVDADGNPMSVNNVVRLARFDQADEVYWQEGDNSGRDLLFSAQGRDMALAGDIWEFDPAADSPVAEEIRPGVWKMHGSTCGDRFESIWWERSAAPLIAKSRPDMPQVYASTFAFPVRVEGVAGRIVAKSLPGDSLQEAPELTLEIVKARIAAEFPAVADPATADVVRVGLLRTWAFEQADLGDGSVQLDTRPDIDYYHRGIVDVVKLFDKDAGGVQSGGAAYFLMKLYEAYGYVAGRISVGFLPSGHHTVTLVQVKLADGQTRTLIEDAFTDLTAVEMNGNPLGAIKVNRMARMRQADKVYWQGGENSGRDLLVSSNGRGLTLAGANWGFDPATDSPEAREIRPGVWKIHASSRGDRLVSMWWEPEAAPLIARFGPSMPKVLASTFAFPVWVEGTAGKIFERSLPGGRVSAPELTLDIIKARIAAEFPAVTDPATPDVVRVGLLRTWAFEQVDLGDGSLQLDTRPDIDYYHRGIVDLVKLFDNDTGTVYCGGTAYFLMKLYEAYGYVAGRISVGFLPSGNHTVTLVQVKLANGQTDILIQDAFTDLTPVNVNGNPLGAIRVARMARAGRGDQVYWQGGHAGTRDLLVSAHGRDKFLRGDSWTFDPATDSHDVERIRSGVYKLHTGPHGDRMIWKWWNKEVAPAIRRANSDIPLVLASTFAFPLWVEGLAGELSRSVFTQAT